MRAFFSGIRRFVALALLLFGVFLVEVAVLVGSVRQPELPTLPVEKERMN